MGRHAQLSAGMSENKTVAHTCIAGICKRKCGASLLLGLCLDITDNTHGTRVR